jgi:hypothetical protein
MDGNEIILCKNEEEFQGIQKYFFSIGIFWAEETIENKQLIITGGEKLALRKNKYALLATGDYEKYKNNDYTHIDSSKYTFIKAETIFRKIKLNKLKEYESGVCR